VKFLFMALVLLVSACGEVKQAEPAPVPSFSFCLETEEIWTSTDFMYQLTFNQDCTFEILGPDLCQDLGTYSISKVTSGRTLYAFSKGCFPVSEYACIKSFFTGALSCSELGLSFVRY